jgi:poly(A) polymerase
MRFNEDGSRDTTFGQRFRLVHVMFGQETVEVSTFRALQGAEGDIDQVKDANGRLLRDNVFGSQAEDALRRDFTVNALYFDPITSMWFDPWGGKKDLLEKRLHPVSSRFAEDPLRVLRGMQMIARFDLTPSEECIRICRGLSQKHLARERIWKSGKSSS